MSAVLNGTSDSWILKLEYETVQKGIELTTGLCVPLANPTQPTEPTFQQPKRQHLATELRQIPVRYTDPPSQQSPPDSTIPTPRNPKSITASREFGRFTPTVGGTGRL